MAWCLGNSAWESSSLPYSEAIAIGLFSCKVASIYKSDEFRFGVLFESGE